MRATKNVTQAIERIAPFVEESMIVTPAEERGRYVLTPTKEDHNNVDVTLRAAETLARLALCADGDTDIREAVRWRGKIPARMDGRWDGYVLQWLKGWEA